MCRESMCRESMCRESMCRPSMKLKSNVKCTSVTDKECQTRKGIRDHDTLLVYMILQKISSRNIIGDTADDLFEWFCCMFRDSPASLVAFPFEDECLSITTIYKHNKKRLCRRSPRKFIQITQNSPHKPSNHTTIWPFVVKVVNCGCAFNVIYVNRP